MKAQIAPQDVPKVVALVAALVLVVGYIGITMSRSLAASGGSTRTTAASASHSAPAVEVAAKSEDPMAYIRTIEQFSAPPPAPVGGDPFRMVVASGRSSSSGSGSSSRPPRIPGEIPMVPFGVDGAAPGVQIGSDFPEVYVQGVIVDYAQGPAFTYAVLTVAGATMYVKPGDKLRDDLEIDKITESGIWLQAAKERVFVEVSRSFKPVAPARM